MYVTFQLKTIYNNKTKKYAVQVNNMEEAYKVMADVNSFDGFTYIRLNKCSKFREKKNIRFMTVEEYFKYTNWM